MGFREYRKSRDNYQFVTQVGSLQHVWKVRPFNACPVAVINLLAAQERRPEPTQVMRPLELL